MKHLRLFLATLVATFALGAHAQTWTPDAVGEGKFILYNVGTNSSLTKGNGWNNQATIGPSTNGMDVTLQLVNGKYFISTTGSYGLECLSDRTVYTDQSRNKKSTWDFVLVSSEGESPVYNIVSADNHAGGSGVYLTANAENTVVGSGTDGTSAYAQWKLYSIENHTTLNADMENATADNPVNATMLIGNANFSYITNQYWTMESGNKNLRGGTNENPCAESWQAAFTLSQTLSVPNGKYQLTAQAAVTEYTPVTGQNMPYIYANDQQATFQSMTQGEASMAAVSNNFSNGMYVVGPIEVTVSNGTLTVGAKGTRTNTWCVFDNFQLTYLGIDLTDFANSLAIAIDKANALNGTIPATVYEAVQEVVSEYNNTYTTVDDYNTAITAVNEAVAAAKTLQAEYARYKSIRNAIVEVSNEDLVANADTQANTATTNELIEEAVVAVRQALLEYLPTATIAEGEYLDLTNALVDNPTVRQNTTGWTIEGTQVGNDSFGKCDFGECEFYNQNFKFYQTLTLPAGTWEFGVTGFHRGGQGDFNTYFYAGEDKILIPGVESSVVNTMAAAQTYFDNGNGKVALKFGLEEVSNELQIGIDNQDTQTDKWTIFRDFTLKFYGSTVDYSVYAQAWNEAVAAAQSAITANANVTGEELTALNNAIANAPTDKKADYLAKTNAVIDATSAFTAAAPAYNAYAAEKAKADLISTTIAESISTPTTAAEAAEAVHNLMVAEYNYVTDNYKYAVDLGTWNASENAGTMTSQHWDGTTTSSYLEQGSGDLAYNLQEWTVTYNQNVMLPAGNYIFKVAGRTHADHVTLTLNVTNGETVLGTVNDFPKGDTGLGINKEGATSFDANDEAGFANEGNGRGWQWRYVKFTLEEPATVNVGVVAQADAQHRWMSFCNASVLTDNEANVDLMKALVKLNNAKTIPAPARREEVGTGIFEYDVNVDNNLWDAYTTAKNNVDNYALTSESTAEEVNGLVDALNAAIDNYNDNQTLVAPETDKRYNIIINDGNQPWNQNAVTFIEGGREDMGGFAIQYLAPADANKCQALKFTPVEGYANTYKVSALRADGREQYITTGSTYEGNDYQIRTTDDEEKSSWIKIEPAAGTNAFKMLNVSAGNAVIARNEEFPDNGMYTSGDCTFNIVEATQASVPVAIAADKYATRIFPFAPAAIEGVTFYSCEGSEEGDVLTLTEVTEPQANVPYILLASEDVNVNLSGWGLATQDSYTAGWLTGVFAEANVPAGSYVLQTGDDNKQAFFVVDEEEIAAPAYRAYLTVPATETGDARAFYFSFGEATGINAVDKLINGNAVIYDLQGRKVEHPTRGLYIINGKKVVIK